MYKDLPSQVNDTSIQHHQQPYDMSFREETLKLPALDSTYASFSWYTEYDHRHMQKSAPHVQGWDSSR